MAEDAVKELLDRKEIQGIVLFSYGSLPSARFYFMHIDDPAVARRWLGEARRRVRHAGDDHKDWQTAFNLGFTLAGLEALGVDEDTRRTFPREMQQTMADAERAMVLGDEGESAPANWELGNKDGVALHLVAMVYGLSAKEVGDNAISLGLHHPERCGARVVTCIESERIADGREHFGFRDGLSQPKVVGMPASARDADYQTGPEVAAGEFVLGYPNEYEQLPLSPSVKGGSPGLEGLPPLVHDPKRHDLGKNGTYLVLRKLQQHVSAFWSAMRANAPEGGAQSLAERIVGRQQDGRPLGARPHGRPNDFDFADDAAGERCPIGAHIRRANPRAALARDITDDPRAQAKEVARAQKTLQRHRLLRRGRPYGPPVANPNATYEDDGLDRGLVFAVVNTNIARQFEFVQQTWMKSTKFDGLFDEDDPLVGQRHDVDSFTLQGRPSSERVRGLPRFVTTRGGGYFFVPSLAALSWIGDPERG